MRVMEMLSGKWRLKVLFQLSLHERMRFSELKKSIPGITSAMLTTALRELEGYGVVSRRQYEEIPPRVEYSLTQSGRDLYPIFFEMARWAQRHLG
jgi:DNA-binding HxlR family transcriptional regulator